MKKFLLTIGFALGGILSSLAQAQVVSLTIDPSQSSVDLTVAGSQGSSQLSGDVTLDLQSTDPPSGTAQITDLNLVADDGFSFSFFVFVSASTSPGDVTLSMVTPGAPGTISAGSFDQLANVLEFGGDLIVSDPFGLAGGNDIVDLSTIELSPFDFNAVNVTQSGDVITLSVSFAGSQPSDFGDIEVDATFVATGVVPDTVLKGDVDMDGDIDFNDITPFITVLQAGGFQAEADCDCSGVIDFADIPAFIAILQMQ